MVTTARRRGRPRRKPRGLFAETTELAELLREVIDASGMDRKVYTARMEAADLSVATLYRRLRAEGLERDAQHVVNVVFTACAPVSPEARKRADELLRALADKTAAPQEASGDNNHQSTGDQVSLGLVTAQMSALQQQVLRLQQAVDVITDLRNDVRQLLETVRPAEPRIQAIPRDGDQPGRAVDTGRSAPKPTDEAPEHSSEDAELQTLLTVFQEADPDGVRMGGVLRRALDYVLDGGHTGRFQWAQLSKVEKSLLGQVIERELSREFDLTDGSSLDFRIGSIEFDVFYANGRRWLVPPEAEGRLVLLIGMDHSRGRWDAGLVRIRPELLQTNPNRDGKRRLRDLAGAVQYLRSDMPLPRNVIEVLGDEDRRVILTCGSGQQRLEELLRRMQGRPIDTATIATVTRQRDLMKRIRDAGIHLAAEGIAVLGRPGVKEDSVARALGLPDLDGKVMSLRLVRHRLGATDEIGVEIGGDRWVPAKPGDPLEPLPSPLRIRRNLSRADET